MLFDKRKHERRDIVKTIEYVMEGVHGSESLEGIIANISDSGFCLLTTSQLESGTNIAIRGQMFPGHKSAAVRWSMRNRDLYYRVGLKFL
jgi:hypothetical protein